MILWFTVVQIAVALVAAAVALGVFVRGAAPNDYSLGASALVGVLLIVQIVVAIIAPLAYSLSLVSGIVYIVATIALIKRTGAWRTVAWIALAFELTGVLVVGTLSFTHPELFAHPSAWSWFGAGYLLVPLFLPMLGMLWLRRTRPTAQQADDAAEPRAAA